MKKELDVIALGMVAMDYYLFFRSFSSDQEKIWARSADFFPGGTMGNFAAAAAKLGLKTGIVGVVGRDLFGDWLKKDFDKLGVDTAQLKFHSKGRTPVPVIIKDDAAVRTILIPPFMHIKLPEVDPDYLKKARVLHTHLFDFDLCRYCAQMMKESRALFSLDLELHRVKEMPASKLNELLSMTHVVFCNLETLNHIEPGPDVIQAARRMKSRGPEMVVITLGDQGSLAVPSRGKAIQVSSPEVEAVDATGAGDCFAGCFYYGHLKGWPLSKTMRYASAASAAVVTRYGARTGQPKLAEFLVLGKAFINRRGR
jgi:5-dehydro-2-deoxygluconokinase